MDVSSSLHGDELFLWYNFSTGYMVLLLCYQNQNGQKLGQKVLDLLDDPLGEGGKFMHLDILILI